MITLAHLSDMHVSPLPPLMWHEFTLKRALAYLSWHRKRKYRFSSDVLACLIDDMHAHFPEHILVTGDQCNLSLRAEFTIAASWLNRIGNADKVSVIAGNHDAHLRNPAKVWREFWADYMQGDAPTNDDTTLTFPYLRKRGGVALIGVSSAIPTSLFFANGRVGKAQLVRLRTILRTTRDEGFFRVVMIHHPPHIGAVSWRKSLSDATQFRALLKQEGAELILHGHGHVPTRAHIEGPENAIHIRGTAAASSSGIKMPPAHYHLIKIASQENNPTFWQVSITHRQFDVTAQSFFTSDVEELEIKRPIVGFDRLTRSDYQQ